MAYTYIRRYGHLRSMWCGIGLRRNLHLCACGRILGFDEETHSAMREREQVGFMYRCFSDANLQKSILCKCCFECCNGLASRGLARKGYLEHANGMETKGCIAGYSHHRRVVSSPLSFTSLRSSSTELGLNIRQRVHCLHAPPQIPSRPRQSPGGHYLVQHSARILVRN